MPLSKKNVWLREAGPTRVEKSIEITGLVINHRSWIYQCSMNIKLLIRQLGWLLVLGPDESNLLVLVQRMLDN